MCYVYKYNGVLLFFSLSHVKLKGSGPHSQLQGWHDGLKGHPVPQASTGLEMPIPQLSPRKHERKSSGVSGGSMASGEDVFAPKKEPQKGIDPAFLEVLSCVECGRHHATGLRKKPADGGRAETQSAPKCHC